MNILVLDVAAESGGALTVLREFYGELDKDNANRYFFCVSLPEFASTDNITVLRFPWVKRSWLERLRFDTGVVNRLTRAYRIDRVLSLQNTAAPCTGLPQTVYVHQALPYTQHRFSLSESKKLWVYQNVIGRIISHSVKKADKVIVQTNWMKDAVCAKDGIPADRIEVRPPQTDPHAIGVFDKKAFTGDFFYPADMQIYKDHLNLLRAAAMLKEAGTDGFRLILTLTPEEIAGECAQLLARCKDSVVLTGRLPIEKVLEMYTHTALVFPSYLETFGLPLLEARQTGCPAAAGDTPFAHEILDGYEHAVFFDPFDPDKIAGAMNEILTRYKA